MPGTLYLCATPIGNLEDITLRVLRTLREVNLIAAEDTRHSLRLLNRFEIRTPLISYHEHNKRTRGLELVSRLETGENIAYISDAGMPGISDPGEELVRLCLEHAIPVTVCPGACACVTALVLSGLEARRFVFEGFLPAEKKQRAEVFARLKNETRTIVIYEAPHKLLATLNDLLAGLGDRKTAAIKELTKKYETVLEKPLSELTNFYSENEPRGEFVLVVSGADTDGLKAEKQQAWFEMKIEDHVGMYTSLGLSEMDAIKAAAKDRGVPKREVYAQFKRISG